MCESDKLWCAFREMGERITELEVRLSLIEDEYDDDDGDVTLEDRLDDGLNILDTVDVDAEWDDKDEDDLPMHIGPSVPEGEGQA
jgi:hypothetical protein